MDVLQFIINNFDNLIAILIIFTAIIFAFMALKYPMLKEQLKQLITEAEIKFPMENSGELKKSEVLRQIYELLPSWMKTFVSYGMLSWVIEKTLILCKKMWEENENIGSYIEEEKKKILNNL